MRFLPDSSCMIAAACSWHEFHERAIGEMRRRLERSETMITAGPTLVETYSVLTRLPSPQRLLPAIAWQIIEQTYIQQAEIVALTAAQYSILLSQMAQAGGTGGQVYDTVILSCATHNQVNALLTFNARHFGTLPHNGLEIVTPQR